jgi:cold shock CspA family protein
VFDWDPRLSAHLKKLQGTIEVPSPPRRERRKLETKNVFLGTVSRWNKARAFGFIASDGPCGDLANKDEIFCHRTALPEGVSSLEPGWRVEFTLAPAHLAGKPRQARVTRVISQVEEAA